MKSMAGDEVTDLSTVETCARCGMVANLDPWLHAERYGHQPQVWRDGQVLVHNGYGAFTRKGAVMGQDLSLPSGRRHRERPRSDFAGDGT